MFLRTLVWLGVGGLFLASMESGCSSDRRFRESHGGNANFGGQAGTSGKLGSGGVSGEAGEAGSAGTPAHAGAAGSLADGGAAGAAGAGGAGKAGGEGGVGGESGSGAIGPSCARRIDCPEGQNCEAGTCVPALQNCARHKSKYPSASDGVYWIQGVAGPLLAFCDMRERSELCTQERGSRSGRLRDASGLGYSMTSLLIAEESRCEIYNLVVGDGYPLSPAVGTSFDTCQALGFVRDSLIQQCQYGDAIGGGSTSYADDCGYDIDAYRIYGTYCTGCTEEGDGAYDHYVRQGPIHWGQTIATADGSVRSYCAIE
ncbi:MAG: hypothetical protein ACOY0T_21285 [Myxococcota bacterium]